MAIGFGNPWYTHLVWKKNNPLQSLDIDELSYSANFPHDKLIHVGRKFKVLLLLLLLYFFIFYLYKIFGLVCLFGLYLEEKNVFLINGNPIYQHLHHFTKNSNVIDFQSRPLEASNEYYFLISIWIALFRSSWLYFGFFLQLNFQFVSKKESRPLESDCYIYIYIHSFILTLLDDEVILFQATK